MSLCGVVSASLKGKSHKVTEEKGADREIFEKAISYTHLRLLSPQTEKERKELLDTLVRELVVNPTLGTHRTVKK